VDKKVPYRTKQCRTKATKFVEVAKFLSDIVLPDTVYKMIGCKNLNLCYLIHMRQRSIQ